MIHITLLMVCILSVEVFIKFNLLSSLNEILLIFNKVKTVIPNKHISDHWKEKVIPTYSKKIMFFSLKILFF